MKKLEGVKILNDGNPIEMGSCKEGFLFTVSPSTAKKKRGYYTDKPVPLTKAELKMPGVVVAQNRGMIFSSSRKIAGKYTIPELKDMNVIIVDEVSRKLKPVDDKDNRIFWKGNGDHVVKDVIADGQGQHWFCNENEALAVDLWLKVAKFGYGIKGMLQPGLATDIGCKVIDHWGKERTITKGNTLLLNSSLVKGLGAYDSLEELIAHGEEWGLTTMEKQWQSGDHKSEKTRPMGTQPNSTNLALTDKDIESLIRKEALDVWFSGFEKIAWMKAANIHSSRGRAIAARPSLMYNQLIMNQVDSKAGNTFSRLANGKFHAEGQYLKMYMDKLVFSLVYVHGMNPNEAAKKAAETGLHGEIRVNPNFAGLYYEKDENGKKFPKYTKKVGIDNKGLFIEMALVRYPHGAPSETITVKVRLDATVPEDVIIFPAPVANDDGTVPVATLYAFRLQGADFDGDAVTAFTEPVWLEAQKRNIGKPYMVIPVNTEGTEKDKTLVTDETWESFCMQKVASLSNEVGLIATSLKYFFSQEADSLRSGEDDETNINVIVDHACAMGDDIDEFKHGKANNKLVKFVVMRGKKETTLYSPYFNRYAKKYKTKDDFNKAYSFKNGSPKKPGMGILDMYAMATEKYMLKAGLPVVKEVSKASDGTDRFFMTVHPVKWEAKDVDLHIANGEGQLSTSLPPELEKLYGVEPGTIFGAKSLFQMLYRNHSASLKDLSVDVEDDDERINAISKLNERYDLARVTIVAWTKKMKREKARNENLELSAEDALKIFATLMVQHTKNGRSVLETLTRCGTFTREDGTTYEKTMFSALRCMNYFLDVCGDGLLLIGEEKPDFPEVKDKIMEAANVQMPDLDKAKELARKKLALIGKCVSCLNMGIDKVKEIIDNAISFEDDDLSAYNDFIGEENLSADECEPMFI